MVVGMENSKPEWKTRWKNADPQDTVNKIETLLKAEGFDLQYEEYPSQYDFCYCSSLKTNGFNSNGKGASRNLCKASAYAETMERFQNKSLNRTLKFFDPYYEEMYRLFPNQALSGEQPDCVVNLKNRISDSLGQIGTKEDRDSEVDRLLGEITLNGEYVYRPFFSVKNHSRIDLPVQFFQLFTGTNGMSAGNTLSEAIIQSLSEIFERYAVIQILTKKMIPPELPDEVIESVPSIPALIQKIEQNKDYKIKILDGSLGEGIPCVMCVIYNRRTQTIGFKAGAHPDIRVALERCFTEAMQGRNLDMFTRTGHIDFKASGRTYWVHLRNILKISAGDLPLTLFLSSTPSWEYKQWESTDAVSEKTILDRMLNKMIQLAGDVFIQDVSFLGFPSVYIYAPGISEVAPVDYLWLNEVYLLNKGSEIFCHLDTVSDQETEDLLKLAKLKRGFLQCNTINYVSRSAFNCEMPGSRDEMGFLAAACCYKLGRDEEALRFLSNAPRTPYVNGVKIFINALCSGYTIQQIKEVLINMTGHKITERILHDFGNRESVLDALYPRCRYQCEDCNVSCEQTIVRQTYLKLLYAEAKANIGTENLEIELTP